MYMPVPSIRSLVSHHLMLIGEGSLALAASIDMHYALTSLVPSAKALWSPPKDFSERKEPGSAEILFLPVCCWFPWSPAVRFHMGGASVFMPWPWGSVLEVGIVGSQMRGQAPKSGSEPPAAAGAALPTGNENACTWAAAGRATDDSRNVSGSVRAPEPPKSAAQQCRAPSI